MNSPALATQVVTIQAGTTIFIPSGPSGDHLFVTVFDIKIINGKQKVLLAPFESWFSKGDPSCILDVGDHTFIKHKTFVGYSNCRIYDVVDLVQCINAGTFRIGDSASIELTDKIRTTYIGAKRVKRFIRDDWGE
ncbi:hypothetical protein PPH94_011895 [Burkholderia cepacia]|uniref:hypothetical protein n=1 Tax=Burkholderia cepacia TaxID=292 RepID=UPI00234B6394|nr:hypothetical protein [Burkholderia cepacia]MDC6102476.1 hypothetical protein [Burkholderia cepacia]